MPYKAAAMVVNNTVSNLFKNKVYKAQVRQMDWQNRISELSTQQAYDLQTKLQAAQSDEAKFKILEDAQAEIDATSVKGASDIYSTALNTQSNSTRNTVLIIGFACIALLGAGFLLTKNK